ncbi:hypothetical protein KSB_64040 [Ktedonobacter robiniae]|uniref:Uncharacterized protein n=1 Tax=Ktedonobacter robiniae TaxID=2778365 RepID=A0ABQ3UYK5_9CHLR|nr:hypothetical protein KSB_64040 [Ktedonobacter robiniae]
MAIEMNWMMGAQLMIKWIRVSKNARAIEVIFDGHRNLPSFTLFSRFLPGLLSIRHVIAQQWIRVAEGITFR